MRRVISRNRLGDAALIERPTCPLQCRCVLGQGFTLSLEQVMAGLCALELALHQTQRLARREDGLSCLEVSVQFGA
jgi:hypothetical protein